VQALLKLEWISDPAAAAQPRIEAAPLASPGADHVAELLHLGRIGYVRGIEAKLDQLDADADNRAFVAAMRGHLRNFDFDGYTSALEAIGGNG